MKPRDVRGYEQNRLFRGVLGRRWFFCPRVQVLESGVRRVVGRKYDVTDDLQPYLLPEHRQESAEPGHRLRREVGPLERSLWQYSPGDPLISSALRQLVDGARASLRRQGNAEPDEEEVTSEAVEAAEALGL